MNPRVLELLKNPKNIQPEDVHLLKGEIDAFPYIQNIRALHLYGVHLYEKENYQKELSTTAAYTTDKKILYQLINGKIEQKPKPKIQQPVVQDNKTELDLKNAPKPHFYQSSSFPLRRESEEVTDTNDTVSCALQSTGQEVTYVYIDGERNRILFEGEENFLTEEHPQTIILNAESLIAPSHEAFEEIEEFEPETIIEEEKINDKEEKEDVLAGSELSFHETESFLPDVQINTNETEEVKEMETVSDEPKEENKIVETSEFTPEKIINEDRISSEEEQEIVHSKEELSFHGMESFLPEVKIQANNSEEIITDISPSHSNKHEDEMRRLIEEVEKKMKEKAVAEKIKREEEPENINHEISFAETQSFEVTAAELKVEEEVKPESVISEIQPEITEEQPKEVVEEKPIAQESEEAKPVWRPMSFESNLPDSLLDKSAEIPPLKVETIKEEAPKQEEAVEEIAEVIEDQTEPVEEPVKEVKTEEEAPEIVEETKEEDVPVMNVSFFSSNWTIAQPEKEKVQEEIQDKKKEEVLIETPKTNPVDSNVPGFINTWQSWLKIDRTEEVEKEKIEIKTKAIENFIENNPKISQLREESTYVVKEKNDDISHLMTETLATLYFEQKLYTKAIKAFEILIKKNPEKEEYFKAKIQEIKDFRSKN
ncbi:hypothetical protein PFY12_08730 [Chryseobacterium camelliae]|uniref:Tetratricopeptide repeat protein n=1 Tax=Chryseobacterium camelliae TaxID=1265445 RepID=A0ABY7QHS5_9FLAO|nr:hypothetical protein [Chryseobacterium camelliae]WBV59149.1 hypothetical protein PFY12_08730 [Chryseobacterium camelliae]